MAIAAVVSVLVPRLVTASFSTPVARVSKLMVVIIAALAGVWWPSASLSAQVSTDVAPVADVATEVVVDPASGSLQVTHSYGFANRGATEAVTGFFEQLPWDAADVLIVSDGVALNAIRSPASRGLADWFVEFAAPLEPGETADIEISWHRDGLRSLPNELDLVSPNIVAIAPFAVGQGGTTSLSVHIAGRFDLTEGSGLEEEVSDEGLTLTSAQAAPYEQVTIVLEAPERYVRSQLDSGPVDVLLAAPDLADGWLLSDLRESVPQLAEWIPLTPPGQMEFRQGWTGKAESRLADDGAIVLSPDVDPGAVVGHIADAWLSEIDFSDPDLRTSLAFAIAGSIAGGLEKGPPSTSWTRTAESLVVRGDAQVFAMIFSALDQQTPAYRGQIAVEPLDEVDWRRLLDVVEHVALVDDVAMAFDPGLSSQGVSRIDDRAEALDRYEGLADRAAPWEIPPFVRQPLEHWEFAAFSERAKLVDELLDRRDELELTAAQVSLQIGPFLPAVFEAETSNLEASHELLADQIDTLEVLAEAQRLDIGDRGLLSAFGMAGFDSEAQLNKAFEEWNRGEFAGARDEAESLVTEYEGAVGRGVIRVVTPGSIVILILLFWNWLRGWIRTRRVARSFAPSPSSSEEEPEP